MDLSFDEINVLRAKMDTKRDLTVMNQLDQPKLCPPKPPHPAFGVQLHQIIDEIRTSKHFREAAAKHNSDEWVPATWSQSFWEFLGY